MKKWLCAIGFMCMASVANANDTVTNQTTKLIVACDSSTLISATPAQTTKIISGAPGRRIYVCGYNLVGTGFAGAQFWYGTGTTCFTGLSSLTGVMNISTGTVVNYGGGLGMVLQPSPPGQDLCINNTLGTSSIAGVITWTQL